MIGKETETKIVPLNDVEMIYLDSEPILSLGASYQSDIFYQYHQKIPKDYGHFGYECHELYFYKYGDGQSASAHAMKIEYGMEMRIYDLWIMFLGKIMLLKSTEGDLRIAFRERRSFE